MIIVPDVAVRDYTFTFTSDAARTGSPKDTSFTTNDALTIFEVRQDVASLRITITRRIQYIPPLLPGGLDSVAFFYRVQLGHAWPNGSVSSLFPTRYDSGFVLCTELVWNSLNVGLQLDDVAYVSLPCDSSGNHHISLTAVRLYLNGVAIYTNTTPVVNFTFPSATWGAPNSNLFFYGTPLLQQGFTVPGPTLERVNSPRFYIGASFDPPDQLLIYNETSTITWSSFDGVTLFTPEFEFWPSPVDPTAHNCNSCSPMSCNGTSFPDAILTAGDTKISKDIHHLIVGDVATRDLTNEWGNRDVAGVLKTSPYPYSTLETLQVLCTCNLVNDPAYFTSNSISSPASYIHKIGKNYFNLVDHSNLATSCFRIDVEEQGPLIGAQCNTSGDQDDPANWGSHDGAAYRAYIKDGDVFLKRHWNGIPTPGWQGESQVTLTADTSHPTVAESPAMKRLIVGYNRSGAGFSYKASDDDGLTWNTEVSVFSDGTIPRCATNLNGDALFASFKYDAGSSGPGTIRGKTRLVGDTALSSQFTFKDSASANISFTDHGFDITDVKDNQGRWMLTAQRDGHSDLEEWWSADNGRTWNLVA